MFKYTNKGSLGNSFFLKTHFNKKKVFGVFKHARGRFSHYVGHV